MTEGNSGRGPDMWCSHCGGNLDAPHECTGTRAPNAPNWKALAAQLASALEPFADACHHLHPSSPDEGVTLDGMTVGEWRAAYRALALYTEAQAKEPTT